MFPTLFFYCVVLINALRHYCFTHIFHKLQSYSYITVRIYNMYKYNIIYIVSLKFKGKRYTTAVTTANHASIELIKFLRILLNCTFIVPRLLIQLVVAQKARVSGIIIYTHLLFAVVAIH